MGLRLDTNKIMKREEIMKLHLGQHVLVNGEVVVVAAIHLNKIGYHVSPNRLTWARANAVQLIPMPEWAVKVEEPSPKGPTVMESIKAARKVLTNENKM